MQHVNSQFIPNHVGSVPGLVSRLYFGSIMNDREMKVRFWAKARHPDC